MNAETEGDVCTRVGPVNSIDTSCTQLNVSPTGSFSRISTARSRMSGSSSARFFGATAGVTVFRCGVWRGSPVDEDLDLYLIAITQAVRKR